MTVEFHFIRGLSKLCSKYLREISLIDITNPPTIDALDEMKLSALDIEGATKLSMTASTIRKLNVK